MIKAVIFDMDGVIVDTESILDDNLISYFKEMNLMITKDVIKDFRGAGSNAFWSKLKEIYKLPKSVDYYVKERLKRTLDYYKSTGLMPMPYVLKLIDELKTKEIRAALATSAAKIRMDTTLELLKMRNCFEVTVSAQDVINAKPDPEAFLLACKLLGLKPVECVIVEDSKNGLIAAKNAGMKCIGFKQNEDQDLTGADMIIDSFNHDTINKITTI